MSLHTEEFFHQWLILFEHLYIALGHGTADDERCTGVVDQHGVYLVDDGIVVGALHQVGRRHCHVVAQIVEAELVVRAEGDVGLVGLAACCGVGLVLVDTVDGESVEHIERSHPLRVALGQVVVDGHHVHAVAGQCVKEDGQCSHEGLTLAGGHLGNLALMEHHAAEELHVVVHHLPFQVVAAGCPVVVVDGLVAIDGDKVLARVAGQFAVEVVGRDDGLLVLCEAACRLLDDGIDLGHHLVEGLLVFLEGLFLYLVYLGEDVGTFVDGGVLDGGLQAFYLLFLGFCGSLHLLSDFLCACSEGVIVQYLHLGRDSLYLLYERLYFLHIFRRLVAEQSLQDCIEIHLYI